MNASPQTSRIRRSFETTLGRMVGQTGEDLQGARLDGDNCPASFELSQGGAHAPVGDEEIGLPGTLHAWISFSPALMGSPRQSIPEEWKMGRGPAAP